jgi:tight adherence protein B
MLHTAIYIVFFIGAFCVAIAILNFLFEVWRKWQVKQADKMVDELSDSFIFVEKKKGILIAASPFILGVLLWVAIGNYIGGIIGFVVGLFVPSQLIKMARANRLRQFQSQLVDTLLILSSSLKGGMSIVQAIEVVCEEMPVPTSQEFGLILKENRLGISLEESMNGLRARIQTEEVNLIVTSILVARETGGELPRVFSRLVSTIRSNIKLKQKMATLTLQGRLQGVIMAILPIVFTYYIYKQTPGHFDIMFQTDLGRKLMIGAVVAYVLGLFFIKKISTIKT